MSIVSFKVKIAEQVYLVENVAKELRIAEVKANVEILSSCPRAQQKWIYKGRILVDDVTVHDAGIEEGNTVIVMKTASAIASSATRCNPTSTVPTAAPIPSSSISSSNSMHIPERRVSTARFDAAMGELLQHPDVLVQNAVTVLLKIATNVAMHPMEEKYRRLNRTNAAFSKKLGDLRGGNNCMIALGFHLERDEWVLIPSADAWDNLMACKTKLERFSQKLNQSIGEVPTTGAIPSAAPSTTSSTQPPQPPIDPTNILIVQQLLQTMQLQQQQQLQQQPSETPTTETTSGDGDGNVAKSEEEK